MKKVWKYKVDFPDCKIYVPNGGKIVHVDLQRDIPCLWILIDPDRTQVARRFVVFGTNHEIPDGYRHVGTYQQERFVWHIFEEVGE